ncbi:hypothetical protein [Halococcoides cellulosivorans]|uniref:Uncharacterized protein n=1 Tax=Halococcoides cellulosivorans TaxID=1679096 RepID=A0A2R4X096_9EURY|nr:hypothetical protein [Halococcoides cellulosivorans]AWB27199.1 hypothetical protein HARCEL1_05525 [Halococcoides cellulosivorans]
MVVEIEKPWMLAFAVFLAVAGVAGLLWDTGESALVVELLYYPAVFISAVGFGLASVGVGPWQ